MLRDLLIKTRSYRNFNCERKFTAKELCEIIELCRFTPATANIQPLKFAYAFSDEDRAKIFPCLGWAGYLKENKPPFKGNEPTAYILICGDTDIAANIPMIDVGICAQTIVLGAMEKGIGACMIGNMKKDEIIRIFSLPSSISPLLMIALGEPNEKIVLTDAANGEIKYYRDSQNTHYVPKRLLCDILLPEISAD